VGRWRDGVWEQTQAFHGYAWIIDDTPYRDEEVPFTHFAPFEAPEPPPKPVSLRDAAKDAADFLNAAWRLFEEKGRWHEAERIADRLNTALQLDAISREDADA